MTPSLSASKRLSRLRQLLLFLLDRNISTQRNTADSISIPFLILLSFTTFFAGIFGFYIWFGTFLGLAGFFLYELAIILAMIYIVKFFSERPR